MGGTIAMIVRLPSGHVIPSSISTAELSSGLMEPSFLDGRFDQWWADRQLHLEPLNAVAPHGWGIVVVDFPEKTVFSAQNYTILGSENVYRWWDATPANVAAIRQRHANGRFGRLVMNVMERGRIAGKVSVDASTITRSNLDATLTLLGNPSSRPQLMFLDNACRLFGVIMPEDVSPDASVDLSTARLSYRSAWNFEAVEETALQVASIKRRMDEWGYRFSSNDRHAWQVYLQNRFYYDADLNEAVRQVNETA